MYILYHSSLLYVLAFLCAYVPAMLTAVFDSIGASAIGSSLLALQGFFNLLVFMRRKLGRMVTPQGRTAARVWLAIGGASA